MEQKNEGVCRCCLKTFSSRSMNRHLKSCAEKMKQDEEAVSAGGKLKSIYLLKVMSYRPFWLYIEMASSRKLYELDNFLRAVWLECCGHLSEFEIEGVRYSDSADDASFWGEVSKSLNVALRKVLDLKDTFEYEYDFGSTTKLSGQVIGVRKGVLKEPFRILARNTLPEIACSECGKSAVSLCEYCQESFCRECAEGEKHEEECEVDVDALLPIVNSPRMGVCAYSGDSGFDTFDRAHII